MHERTKVKITLPSFMNWRNVTLEYSYALFENTRAVQNAHAMGIINLRTSNLRPSSMVMPGKKEGLIK